MVNREIQIVSGESGETTAVIVPIELWREIESERETAYLLKSESMKLRLLQAAQRQAGLAIERAAPLVWNQDEFSVGEETAAAIDAGIRAADEGGLISSEEVRNLAKKWIFGSSIHKPR